MDRLQEGMTARHCALSLVGEPIMYPEINKFITLLHEKQISTFLVTNAQFPDAIRYDLFILKFKLFFKHIIIYFKKNFFF